MGFPSGAVGKWVVSVDDGITAEGVLMDFVCMFLCLVHSECGS